VRWQTALHEWLGLAVYAAQVPDERTLVHEYKTTFGWFLFV
jgi:hypothetical protein